MYPYPESQKRRQILTDNTVEQVRVLWDGERFVLSKRDKVNQQEKTIILNPKEMQDLVIFAVTCDAELHLQEAKQ